MSTTQGYSFPKSARLTSTKAISHLYENGQRGGCKPLRYVIHCQTKQEDHNTKVLVSVPKRLFKRAVHRNKLKRRIREAYRLRYARLETLATEHNINIHLGVMYSWDKQVEFKIIDDAMEKLISGIEKSIEEGKHLPARSTDILL